MNNFNDKMSQTSEKEESGVKTAKGTSSSKARRTMNAVFILIFVLVFAGINVLAVFLVNKFPSLEADLTDKGAYSLSDTTKEYLTYMNSSVKVKVLMTEKSLTSYTDDSGSSAYPYQVNQLLREMSTYDKVELEYIDLTEISNKSLSEKYPDIDWSSSKNFILVENGDKYKLLSMYDVFSYDSEYAYYYSTYVFNGQYLEQSVLSAVSRVTSDRIPKVAISVGNGEMLNESHQSYNYYSYISVLLDDNAYDVSTINLLTEKPSEDLDAIIMFAPSYDLSDDAVDNISQWLTNGGEYGKSFIYIPYDYADETPNIDLFLEQWGMKVTQGYINENDTTMILSSGNPAELYNLVNYSDKTYTDGLKDTTRSLLMPFCMPVEILDAENVSPLLVSSDKASTRLIGATGDEASVEYIDSTGEALCAAAVSSKHNDSEKTSSVVVWGSYDGLSNNTLYQYSSNCNNAPYFINLMNTLCDNDNTSILVEGVSLDSGSMTVTVAQQVAIFAVFVVIIPIALAVTGIVVWARRKNL